MKDCDKTLRSSEITIPNVRLGLEDLLIHSLDETVCARVAHALAETETDARFRFRDLITQLAARAQPKITDSDIDREVEVVRNAVQPGR